MEVASFLAVFVMGGFSLALGQQDVGERVHLPPLAGIGPEALARLEFADDGSGREDRVDDALRPSDRLALECRPAEGR